jgi:Type II secretion system (T2SS), protein E, N-terminal domain
MSSNPASDGMFFVDQQPAAPVASPPVAPAPVEAPAPTAEAPAPTGAAMRDVPLGTLIFRAGLLAEEQLEDALQEGMRTGKRLGEVLAERGLIKDTDLGRLLAGQQGLPYVEAATLSVDRAAMERLPENIARMQNALAFALEDGVPVVAVADPTNELVVENVRRALGVEPRLVVAAHGELARKIQEAYSQPPDPAPEPAPAAEPAPAVEPAPAAEPAPVAPVAPVAAAEAPAPVEQPAPVAVAQPEAAPTPAVTPMPTSVPPAEERTPDPEVPTQPLVAAPVAANEVPPLHAQAAAEPPLAPEPVVAEPVAAPAPEAAPAAAPAEPVAPAPAAPAPVEQPPAEPVVIVAETPEPPPADPEQPAAPEQPAEPGLFAQAAEQALATPVAAEPPPAPQEPAPAPAPVEPTHLVVLRLTGEDRVEIGAFGGQDEAESFARTVVGRISRAEEQSEWPLFGDRFIRPQSIASVDVVERSGSNWMGSSARAQWGQAPAPGA